MQLKEVNWHLGNKGHHKAGGDSFEKSLILTILHFFRCENPHCSNPEIACNDLDRDLEAAAKLKAQYPGNCQ